MAKAASAYDALHLPLVVGRTPLLPLQAAIDIFSSPDPLQALRELIEREPLVRHAIYVASPTLSDAVDSWLSGSSLRNRNAPLRAFAYLVRMASRPTPFGICAGIGIVDIGDATTLSVDNNARRTFTRPDMGLLSDIAKTLESGPHRRAIRYITNRSAFARGGRLYVTHVQLTSASFSATGHATEQRPVSLKNTAAVQFVRETARDGQSYETLASSLAERFDAPIEDSETLLGRLIEAGVLMSELRASPVGNPVAYLVERFECIDGATARRVRGALEVAADADKKALHLRSIDEFRSVALGFAQLAEKPPAHSVQIDMKSPFQGHLNAAVLRDVERVGEYWRRMSPNVSLSKFRRRFIERYEGVERMVPLLELVDPNVGLGLPEGPEPEETNRKDRDSAAIRIACEALRTGAEEVELQGKDLDLFLPPLDGKSSVGSMEVGFQLLAPSREAVDAGNYTLVPGSFGGSDRATRSLGRFAHLFGEAALDRIRTVARAGEHPDELVAEFVFAPTEARSYNVSIRPRIFDAEVRVGIGEPSAIDEIQPDDLWVGLENDRFFLWSNSRQRRVTARETHLFATTYNAPNICRFLATVASDGRRWIRTFDWGAAAPLTYLPRVRIGRIVLAPRRWLFDAKDVTKSPEAAARALRRWREFWNVPRYVMLTESDNQLLLDLDSSIAGDLVCDQVEPHTDVLHLEEALPDPNRTWVEGKDGRYAVEFIASLLPGGQTTSAPRNNGATSASPNKMATFALLPARRRYGPGSEWLYVKLYMGTQAFDDFLLRAAAPLMAELREAHHLDRWFFVRYADPEPHLRVRIRSVAKSAVSVRERIVSAAEEWLSHDRVLRYTLDTYDPEYERYGGPERLEMLERFFTLDSDRCLDLLAGMPDNTDARVKAAVESFYPWLLAEDLRSTALTALKMESRYKIAAADRIELKRLAAREFDDPVSTELKDACSGYDGDKRLSAVFHMHCNRLGLSGEGEIRAIALLRALLVSRRARRRDVDLV